MDNNIQEHYCSQKVTNLLKDKGFIVNVWEITHSLAIEWIRVNFNIHIYTKRVYVRPVLNEEPNIKWIGCIDDIYALGKAYIDSLKTYNNTPQEATEAALLYTLTNLIN